jgi:hypothetical protein
MHGTENLEEEEEEEEEVCSSSLKSHQVTVSFQNFLAHMLGSYLEIQ